MTPEHHAGPRPRPPACRPSAPARTRAFARGTHWRSRGRDRLPDPARDARVQTKRSDGTQTRQNGRILIGGLLELKRAFGDGLVNRLAREHGIRLLREQHGDADPEAIDNLVTEAITIVDRIAALQLS